jgi:hypothetical protein
MSRVAAAVAHASRATEVIAASAWSKRGLS